MKKNDLLKYFIYAFLFWNGGITVCALIMAIVFKIGWENKEHILIWGYGGLFTIFGFILTWVNDMKKRQLEVLTKAVEEKAEKSEITNLHYRLDDVKKTVDDVDKKMDKLMYHLIDNKNEK